MHCATLYAHMIYYSTDNEYRTSSMDISVHITHSMKQEARLPPIDQETSVQGELDTVWP